MDEYKEAKNEFFQCCPTFSSRFRTPFPAKWIHYLRGYLASLISPHFSSKIFQHKKSVPDNIFETTIFLT
ncbi:hypothetical protein ACFY4F_19745 [Peribacillus butanolivorans]|uniref:hypothetical protein n=1 Tax=Peribacillus butanolivorans TaxID=421767 RepID=UPI0036C55FC8